MRFARKACTAMTKDTTLPIDAELAVLTFDQVKTAFGDTMLRVARGERLRLTRHGRVRAAIISVEDLELLEQLERRADLFLALKTIGKRNRSYPAAKVFRALEAGRRRKR